ncbi:hypothetical protein BFF78_33545 [Streptomyces fodineus]|uniref:Uncharacterized protein n=1 Tax=Streptomyces fodineus TaxID=1904616 RepID=A0A1D7YIJ5_9ACTN|nr:hypothetical protein BFF78_33545 [Streptomyces fodineus]
MASRRAAATRADRGEIGSGAGVILFFTFKRVLFVAQAGRSAPSGARGCIDMRLRRAGAASPTHPQPNEHLADANNRTRKP